MLLVHSRPVTLGHVYAWADLFPCSFFFVFFFPSSPCSARLFSRQDSDSPIFPCFSSYFRSSLCFAHSLLWGYPPRLPIKYHDVALITGIVRGKENKSRESRRAQWRYWRQWGNPRFSKSILGGLGAWLECLRHSSGIVAAEV